MSKKKRTKLIPAVSSLMELANLARGDRLAGGGPYERLAFLAAENLGGGERELGDLSSALDWLRTNAMETDEEGVVEEINSLRSFL